MNRLPLLILVLVAACASRRQAVAVASYGEPIDGTTLFEYRGNSDARNVGVGAGLQWFLHDRWAVGFEGGYRYYDGGVHAVELEGTVRWYVWRALVLEGTGGGSGASDDFPAGGTQANWVFGFGPTFAIPLKEGTDLLLGYQWRHLSNGKGRVSGNPTQNDHRFRVGVAWDW